MLACFEALARLGSRKTAAAELNVTEGAVAKQLRALEKWLHTPLFESGGREPAMTAAGRRLAQAMTAGMETIQVGLDEVAQRRKDRRELRILAPAALAMRWLVPRLPRIEQAGFRVRVHTTHTGEDWLSLPHDAAIRRDGFLPREYRQEFLFQEELVAYVSPTRLDRIDHHESIKDIPLLESRTRPGELDRWLAAWNVSKASGVRRCFAHFYIAYEAALAGEGLLVAPTLLAAEDVRHGRLVAFKADVRPHGARNMLLWRKADEEGEEFTMLAAWLRQDTASASSSQGRDP
jgi:LysR family transcriptional regulator, glycine cleavage system transcriptional activator